MSHPAEPVAVDDLLDSAEAGGLAIRGSAARLGAYAVVTLLGLIAAALLFRHLGVEDTGRYVTVLALIGLVGAATDAGLTLVGVRELSARPDARREYLRTIIGARLALTTSGVALAIAFAAVVGFGRTVVAGTAIAGVAWLLQSYQAVLTIPLFKDLRLGRVALLDVLRQSVFVVLVVVLVAAGASLLPFFVAAVPAVLVTVVVTAVFVRRAMPLKPSFVAAEWRRLFWDVLPFAAAVAVWSLYFRVPVVLLSLIATATETGYFGASFRIVEALIIIPQLALSAAFPIFARAAAVDLDRFGYAVRRMFEAAVVFGGSVALALALGAALAIGLIGGEDFEPAIPVLRIQGIAMLAAFVTVLWGLALLSLRRHRELIVMNLVGLIVSVALTLALAPSHGAQGAAVATALGEIAIVVAGAVFVVRSVENLRLPLGVLPRVGVAAGAAAALVLVPGLPDIVLLVLAAGVYFGVLFALGAIPKELLVELGKLRPRSTP